MAEGIVCALLVIGAAVVPFMVWATGDRPRPPCICDRPALTVIFDANGYRRWCGRCRGVIHG
jgi:hypothetical protein